MLLKAFVFALITFGLTMVVALLVAGMIKLLFAFIQRRANKKPAAPPK